MWLLGRLLPLLVGGYVPTDDAHWKCFLRLLQIMTVATSMNVNKDTIPLLVLLIKEYLFSFNTIYPDKFTPKLHYLIHLPRQIEL